MITFHAGFVAVSLATREIVIKLIMKMAAERRLAQTIYLQSFAHAADKVFEIVVDYLSEVKDGYVRAACYRALMFSKKDYYFPQEEDLYSANIELRISATKYLGKLPSKKPLICLVK
ncbi:MAG: hypothetical protein HWD59_06470 [Coxiellaceae bacterium]|nr:MAG: hypothetical protein HWD59_06470 [Coxiellaceae bacterium]